MSSSTADANTRPLKRARISMEEENSSLLTAPSTFSLAHLKHHSEFWFDDGNIILIAQQTGFRIFRGLLAAQSTVFADMFAASTSQADETLDGCPVVHLTDSPVDLLHLLRILLPTSPPCYPTSDSEDVRSFDEVSAVIRLSHKYHIQSVQDRAIRALQEYPFMNDFDRFFSPTPLKPKISIHGAQYIGAMNLAHLTDTPIILPYALYKCSLLAGALLDGWKREDGTIEHLCTADIKRCFDGRVAIGQEQSYLIHLLFTPVPRGKCTSQGANDCAQCLEGLACNAVNIARLKKPVFFDWTPSIQALQAVCGECKDVLVERHRAERRRVWDSLPKMFRVDVEGWTDAGGAGAGAGAA